MLSPIEVTLTARHCLHMREVDATGWLAKRDEDAIIETAVVLEWTMANEAGVHADARWQKREERLRREDRLYGKH